MPLTQLVMLLLPPSLSPVRELILFLMLLLDLVVRLIGWHIFVLYHRHNLSPINYYMADQTIYQYQGYFYLSDNFDATTTGPTNYFFSMQGDTIRILLARTITNSTDPGYTGEICFDGNYLYYCVSGDGTNTGSSWVRAPFSSW